MCLTHSAIQMDLFWYYYKYYVSKSMNAVLEEQFKQLNNMLVDTIAIMDTFESLNKKLCENLILKK